MGVIGTSDLVEEHLKEIMWFYMHPTIAALIETILADTFDRNFSQADPSILGIARALHSKITAMPFVLKSAMIVLTYIFNWCGFFSSGRFFSAQDLKERRDQITKWRRSTLPICREFISFYEKMTLFIYYSYVPAKFIV